MARAQLRASLRACAPKFQVLRRAIPGTTASQLARPPAPAMRRSTHASAIREHPRCLDCGGSGLVYGNRLPISVGLGSENKTRYYRRLGVRKTKDLRTIQLKVR